MLGIKGIIRVGCWAHVRRKFYVFLSVTRVAAKISKTAGTAHWFLNKIQRLHIIEKKAKDDKLTIEDIKELRQKEAKPIVEEIKQKPDEKRYTVAPKPLTGKAIQYALNIWDKLIKYLEDGKVPIDINLVENKIRPFVAGRKKRLFNYIKN